VVSSKLELWLPNTSLLLSKLPAPDPNKPITTTSAQTVLEQAYKTQPTAPPPVVPVPKSTTARAGATTTGTGATAQTGPAGTEKDKDKDKEKDKDKDKEKSSTGPGAAVKTESGGTDAADATAAGSTPNKKVASSFVLLL
jgi:hypothetical protein